MRNPFAPKPISAEAFWQFIDDNHRAIESSDGKAMLPWVKRVAKKLDAYDKTLVFEMGRGPDKVFEFTVSADGMRERFPAVHTLVAAAPPIGNWRLYELRQRSDGFGVTIGPQSYDKSNVFFRITGELKTGQIELTLLIENYQNGPIGPLQNIAILLLDATIGEYDAVTSVYNVRYLDKSELLATDLPLSTLPQLIDARKLMTNL